VFDHTTCLGVAEPGSVQTLFWCYYHADPDVWEQCIDLTTIENITELNIYQWINEHYPKQVT